MLKIAEYNKITGKKIELSELEQFGFKKVSIYWLPMKVRVYSDDVNKFINQGYLKVDDEKYKKYKSENNLNCYWYDETCFNFDINGDYVLVDEYGNIESYDTDFAEEVKFDLIESGYVERVKE